MWKPSIAIVSRRSCVASIAVEHCCVNRRLNIALWYGFKHIGQRSIAHNYRVLRSIEPPASCDNKVHRRCTWMHDIAAEINGCGIRTLDRFSLFVDFFIGIARGFYAVGLFLSCGISYDSLNFEVTKDHFKIICSTISYSRFEIKPSLLHPNLHVQDDSERWPILNTLRVLRCLALKIDHVSWRAVEVDHWTPWSPRYGSTAISKAKLSDHLFLALRLSSVPRRAEQKMMANFVLGLSVFLTSAVIMPGVRANGFPGERFLTINLTG